ncbi:response regulator [Fournierella sp.]|uniref:response regulator n=1 Tax=Allofournierella sp. TaxID=1940256 RepID=UPI0025BC0AF7|nr:response regulator [Fournierella sp.]
MYRVIIVEDDPMVRAINQQYVQAQGEFSVEETFHNGEAALAWLQENPADLVILDYYMPVMDGLEFLKKLAEVTPRPGVIVVSAANEGGTVRRMLELGVTDYLVKPFEYERFEQALVRFCSQRRQLDRMSEQDGLHQQQIDRLLAQPPAEEPALKKGLQKRTLDKIREYMRSQAGKAYTSEEISEAVGLSRVTVGRYVNHLVETGVLHSTVDYQTGGRPSMLYQYIPAE